jgi:flagellar hook-associated protein 3 FlgL
MISDYFDVDLNSTFDFTVNGEIIFPEGLEFVFQPNPEVGYHGSEDKKEVLIANGVSVPMGVTASEVLLESGDEKIDVFSLLSSIEKALIEDDGTTLAERLSELQKAQDQVLKRQADLGNLMREIEMAQAKLEDQAFEKEKRLSEVRDLDLAKAAVDVNSAEVNNRLALDSAGRLIQPTLSDFLR